ncbi:hypothetical protein, partial [Corynebacterium coyleae]|uniref:hypothetical protein n=1 Tax=Corynebacterium coyleae TaxID=53374 RepID=UPI00254C2C7D
KHTTTKNALAHYRVLKQHQHTQQPQPSKATAVKAAEPETTTQRKPKSNPSSTTVYLAQQPHEINSFPLASPSRPLEATDEDITTNSQTTQIRSTA